MLEGLGIFRFVFLLAILTGAFLALLSLLLKSDQMQFAIGGFLLFIFTLQAHRKDKTFLKINFHKHKTILRIEYYLLSIPIAALLIYLQNRVLLVVLLTGIYFIPFYNLKIQYKTLNTKLQKIIPEKAFEWKAGVRRNLFIIIPVWIAGILFSYFQGAVPLALLVLGIFPLKFFETGESLPMLLSSEQPPGKFLITKFRIHLLIFSILCFPLITAFLVLHPEIWYIVVVEFILIISLHFYFIILKYAWYQPGQKPGGVEAFSAMGVIGIIIPVFLPLVWLLTLWFYFKAISNLKLFLHDFD